MSLIVLASSLACSGLLDTPDVEEEPVAEPEAPADLFDGPWLFALQPEGERCRWVATAPGLLARSLGDHDGACPSHWSVGVDADGVPFAALTEDGQVLVRTDEGITAQSPPPTGTPRRAGQIDGVLTVDTLLASFDGPPTFEGHTHSKAVEGIAALAIRWTADGDGGWASGEVVDTDEGWDHALGVDALPPMAGFPEVGDDVRADSQELPLTALDANVPRGGSQEGWLMHRLDGGGTLAVGYVIGEGIHPVPPAALQIGGRWQPVDFGAADDGWLEARVAPPWVVLARLPDGPTVVVDSASGDELLRIDAPAWLMAAP